MRLRCLCLASWSFEQMFRIALRLPKIFHLFASLTHLLSDTCGCVLFLFLHTCTRTFFTHIYTILSDISLTKKRLQAVCFHFTQSTKGLQGLLVKPQVVSRLSINPLWLFRRGANCDLHAQGALHVFLQLYGEDSRFYDGLGGGRL